MDIFKYKQFHRWAKSEKLDDKVLRVAIQEIENGLYEANLGGGLFKKRIARSGAGKQGGYRTLLAFKRGHRAFFIYGFAKNEQANIDNREREVFKKLAHYYLNLAEVELDLLIEAGEIIEVRS